MSTVTAKLNNDSSPQQQQHPRNDNNPAIMDPALLQTMWLMGMS